eukprot:COSAG01_NODE_1321_length_10740_cov_4.850860_6_plen_173_part_00
MLCCLYACSSSSACVHTGAETLVRRFLFSSVPASIEFADDQTLLYATQRFPGVPRERQLEEKMLARWAGRRLGTCATGYKTEVAGFDMEWAKNFSIWTRPPVKCPRVTNDALEALDLHYRCDGCGRPEASMATRMGHQRHCPYLLLIDTWENPEDSDGEWAVEQILDVRGPP